MLLLECKPLLIWRKNMSIKGIIFDVDGVICDSEKLHREAWRQILATRNVFLADDKSGVGRSDKAFLEELQAKGTMSKDLDTRQIQDEKLNVLVELAEKKAELFPKTKEMLAHFKNDYLLSVASNSDRKFVLTLLENTDILQYFKAVLAINDIKHPKPAPDIYLLAAERMGLKPQECIVIEDSTIGIESAKNAAMKCIAVAHTLPKERLKKADILLDKISAKKIEQFIKEQS